MKYTSVPERLKAFGAKVTREKDLRGYYIYHGVNFTAGFNEAECESIWWEVDLYVAEIHPDVYEHFHEDNNFDRKKDVVWALFCLDQEITERWKELRFNHILNRAKIK